MKLGKMATQAVLTMAYLATRKQDGLIQASTVGEHLNIPTEAALNILKTLSRNRLIIGQIGRSGGYRMHRPVEEITLLEIIEAIDGPITAQVPIVSAQDHLRPSIDKLQDVCQRSADGVRHMLTKISVAEFSSTI